MSCFMSTKTFMDITGVFLGIAAVSMLPGLGYAVKQCRDRLTAFRFSVVFLVVCLLIYDLTALISIFAMDSSSILVQYPAIFVENVFFGLSVGTFSGIAVYRVTVISSVFPKYNKWVAYVLYGLIVLTVVSILVSGVQFLVIMLKDPEPSWYGLFVSLTNPYTIVAMSVSPMFNIALDVACTILVLTSLVVRGKVRGPIFHRVIFALILDICLSLISLILNAYTFTHPELETEVNLGIGFIIQTALDIKATLLQWYMSLIKDLVAHTGSTVTKAATNVGTKLPTITLSRKANLAIGNMLENQAIQSFLDLNPEAVIIADNTGKIKATNQLIEKLVGYTINELLDKPIGMLFSKCLNASYDNFTRDSGQTKSKILMGRNQKDFFIVNKQSTEIPVEICVSSTKIEEHVYFLTIIRDMTEIIKVNDDFQMLLEAAPDGIILADSDGKVMIANQAIENIFGLERSKIVGFGVENLLPTRIRTQHIAHRKGYFMNPSVRPMGVGKELAGLRGDGKEIPLEISLSPVWYGGKQMNLAIIRDNTQKKLFELELISAKETAICATEAKSNFLSAMSHEIRTPINGIAGLTELLRLTELSSGQASYVDSIARCGKCLLHLVNDILDFSKIEAGKMEIVVKDFDFHKLLKELNEFAIVMLVDSDVYFEISSKDIPDKCIIIGDEDRLKQVLLNLLSNAIKFTKKGSIKLQVECRKKTKDEITLQFKVVDTGIGIPIKDRDKIFTMFTQLKSSSSQKPQGTGLGLVITRRLIEKMNGTIDFSSEPDRGSTFSFTLPFLLSDKLVTSPKETSVKHLSGKVLIADDNAINLLIEKKVVESTGCSVVTAADGSEAVFLASNNAFDLILMDIQMPFTDGYEATKQIRGKGISTPIIAVTANAVIGEFDKCISAGMNDYISKPFNSTTLLKKVEKILDSSKSK